MNKIPVGQTIASAYRFAFVELERIIGVIWLPIIALTVIDYFMNSSILSAKITALEANDNSQLGPVVVSQLGFLIAALILKAVIAVAICREVLKPMDRPLWLRFSLGSAEFRYVGAMLGLGAIGAIVALICLMGATALSGGLKVPGLPVEQAALGMAGLVFVVLSPALIYLFVRLGSLALPSVTTESGIGLERSWTLLKGNVGRMVLVVLGTGLPLVLIYVALYLLIVGPEALNPHIETIGDTAAQARHEVENLRQTVARLPWIEGLNFIMAPFLNGVWFAAQALVFKALIAPKPPVAD